MSNNRIPTYLLPRELPSWAKVVRIENGIDIYNMSVFDNIMSWTKNIPNIPAIDYFGNIITYGELPSVVKNYVNGLKSIGIENDDVITMCLPVTVENNILLLAINKLGRIQNSPNFLFLRNDFKTYTVDKGSKTLIILDAYLPFVVDYLETSGIKNVIITNLKDYLPDNQKNRFDDLTHLPSKIQEVFCDYKAQLECKKKISKMRNINFIRMSEVISVGANCKDELFFGPIDIDRDVSYSYTSGTTGMPKCVVFKEQAANALIEVHKGIDTKDYVGERFFQVIPLTYATGERYCGYLQFAKGKTLVPHPIYCKDTFGKDLSESKCNWAVAPSSFYLAGVAQGQIAPDAFKHVTRPTSGGEPPTNSNIVLIDEWLKMNGCNVRFSQGGGTTEDGMGTLYSYFLDETTKTDETGHPLPGIFIKIVDKYGNKVLDGERGFILASSPAAAHRYLNNEEATAKRWIYEDGIRWGITGDIGVKNKNGSYSMLGRASDSIINQDGETIYLFDIERSLAADDPVIEWEINAFKDFEGNNYVVGQVVLKKEFIGKEAEVIKYLIDKYHLFAIKIYNEFELSEVTGKRNYKLLANDYEGYLAFDRNGHFIEYNFSPDGEIIQKNLGVSRIRKAI
ncbi:MAG: acyl--CoA ligase [Mollicutes bacterium]|nr:acyl--CoA ligase [Mollicutes bacterium]